MHRIGLRQAPLEHRTSGLSALEARVDRHHLSDVLRKLTWAASRSPKNRRSASLDPGRSKTGLPAGAAVDDQGFDVVVVAATVVVVVLVVTAVVVVVVLVVVVAGTSVMNVPLAAVPSPTMLMATIV